MTDTQKALDALNSLEMFYRPDSDDCRFQAHIETIRAALEAKVVDVEGLENQIVDYYSKSDIGMPISGIGGITATLNYLAANGYLPKPDHVGVGTNLDKFIEHKGARYYYDMAQQHLRARIDHMELLREAVEMLGIVKRLVDYGQDYAIVEGSAYDKMLITTITKINTALGKETL